MKVALVIRPDGTVPFDEGHPYKEQILGHLVASGHTIVPQPDGTHKILSGPLAPAQPIPFNP